MAKKKPRQQRKPNPTALREVRLGLAEAEKRERAGRAQEARAILEQLTRDHPRNWTIWTALFELGGRLRNAAVVEHACESLLALKPDNPDLLFLLVRLRLDADRPGLALEASEQFLARFPGHPSAEELRDLTESLRPEVQSACDRLGLSGPEGPAALARNEQSLRLRKRGDFLEAQRIAARVLERYPHFVPLLNNLAELHFRQAEFAEAIACERRALETEPENVHALANLVRYLTLTGRRPEALPYAERLRPARPDQPNGWSKKAEAFTCLGDDEAVLEALREAEAEGRNAGSHDEASLSHLAAVAAYRLGREDEARGYWRDALRRMPGFVAAEANLADLDLPPEDQEAPWPYDMREAMPEKVARGIYAASQRVTRKNDPAALARVLNQHLNEHPEVLGILEFQLFRGDRPGREFAVMVAEASKHPTLLPALRDFALGRWGSRKSRMRALSLATEAGLIPSGPVRFWSGTNWMEVLQFNMAIHEEQERHHSPEVERLLMEANEAIYASNGVEAERLLLQARERAPDQPDIQNNLANAYRIQGRDLEADRLMRELHARHPDYLFGCVGMAHIHLRAGRFEEAEELLRPLLSRSRMHRSEVRVLYGAKIELLVARGETDAARSWFQQLEQIDRGHPNLKYLEKLIDLASRKRW